LSVNAGGASQIYRMDTECREEACDTTLEHQFL
jgi:hypothetical protein